jgi:hypothetical protein
MDNELLLLSGENIPFIEAQTIIHQPKLKEISMIGERSFLNGTKFLTFTKNMLNAEDKTGLEDKTDFDIIMSIMCSSEKIEQKNDVTLLLSLLFPANQIKYTDSEIVLLNDEAGVTRINNLNYEVFRDILSSMFCLNEIFEGEQNYNPVGRRAEKIAAKLQAAKQRKAKKAGEETTKVAIYSQYVSILAVGESKSINDLMEYTVFQIMDEFKRFQKKEAYDMNIKARLAGATDLDEVDNWMENIHP